MTSENFEKLVSEWLDEPQRENLREQIDAAARASSDFAALRDEYMRLHNLTHSVAPILVQIDWHAQARHIGESIDASINADLAADDGLARVLGSLPRRDERVDWARLHTRISATIQESETRHRILPFPARVRWALGGIAAAAAIIATFVLWPSRPETQVPQGFVSVTLAMTSALAPSQPGTAGSAVAFASIAGQDDPVAAPAAVAAEVFLMIDPPLRGGSRREVVN